MLTHGGSAVFSRAGDPYRLEDRSCDRSARGNCGSGTASVQTHVEQRHKIRHFWSGEYHSTRTWGTWAGDSAIPVLQKTWSNVEPTVRRIACVLDIFPNKGYKHSLGPFLQALFQGSKRLAGFVLVLILAGAYGWVFLRGPQGLQTLIEKRREIRKLEERNDEIRRENDHRKERRSEQEMEIRKQLKLQRPGETTFILPESEQKDKAPSPPE